MVAFDNLTAEQLGLSNIDPYSDRLANQLCGNLALKGACPISTAYAGHQYGGFARLGDGRAILLGEHLSPSGLRFDIQLKGSGRTSYSRRGDGLATLPTMLKEYISSNAMANFGVPTTRSLALIATGEIVERERSFPGAILVRVASSHIRIGHFEYLAAYGSAEDRIKFINYVLDRHFPEFLNHDNRIAQLFNGVVNRYLALIPRWQGLGFVHGVMNTDNFAISGETLDYGPCAFMDTYIPNHPYSSIDELGRYCYRMQHWVSIWNLAKLAECLCLTASDTEQRLIKQAMTKIGQALSLATLNQFRTKLGLGIEYPGDRALVDELLNLMNERFDFTNLFCDLGLSISKEAPSESSIFSKELEGWMAKWQQRLSNEGRSTDTVIAQMRAHNPWIIPRNHIVKSFMDRSETEDIPSLRQALMSYLIQLQTPFDYSKIEEKYRRPASRDELVLETFCGT